MAIRAALVNFRPLSEIQWGHQGGVHHVAKGLPKRGQTSWISAVLHLQDLRAHRAKLCYCTVLHENPPTQEMLSTRTCGAHCFICSQTVEPAVKTGKESEVRLVKWTVIQLALEVPASVTLKALVKLSLKCLFTHSERFYSTNWLKQSPVKL